MARPLSKRHSRDLRAQILQGLRLEAEKRLGEADRLYAAILDSDPSNFYALYRRAILCAGRGDDIEALRLIQAAMKRSVTVEVLGDCGVILDRLGRSAEAMETYDRALIVETAVQDQWCVFRVDRRRGPCGSNGAFDLLDIQWRDVESA